MSDSIFGTGVPKFIGTGSPDSATRILHYSNLDPKFSDKRSNIFESPVSSSGKRTYKVKGAPENNGRYGEFFVEVFLNRYDENSLGIASLPTAKAFANTLFSYEDKDVIFYPFKDGAADGDGLGKPIKNNANEDVYCHLFDIQWSFLEDISNSYDVMILRFMTNEFYKLSKLIQS